MAGTRTRGKLLVLSSLVLESSGFAVILQGRDIDGMLLVLFGMTFCMMMVYADVQTRPPVAADADSDFIQREVMETFFRKRKKYEFRRRSKTKSCDPAPE